MIKAYSITFWLWLLLALLTTAAIGMQCVRLLHLGDGAAEHALAEGQRVIANLVTGEIITGSPHTEEEAHDTHGAAAHAEDESSSHKTPAHESSAHHSEEHTADESPDHESEATGGHGHHAQNQHGSDHGEHAAAEPAEPAWKRFGHPFSNPDNRPMVALIISSLGLSEYTTQLALTLPGEISLSFSPYAYDISSWADKAYTLGHDVLLNLPMEPEDYPITDPGPHALLSKHTPHEVEENLTWLSQRAEPVVGVLTPGSERLTQDETFTEQLLQATKDHQWLTVIGRTDDTLIVQDVQTRILSPLLLTAVRIDEAIAGEAIATRLHEAEEQARRRGFAIAVAHPHPLSIEAIQKWSETLGDRGVLLAPISALLHAGSGE